MESAVIFACHPTEKLQSLRCHSNCRWPATSPKKMLRSTETTTQKRKILFSTTMANGNFIKLFTISQCLGSLKRWLGRPHWRISWRASLTSSESRENSEISVSSGDFPRESPQSLHCPDIL